MELNTSKEELEKKKLDNEITLQQFEIDNEKRKQKLQGWRKKIKDFSEWSKSWGQVIATFFLGAVGIYFTTTNNKHQEQNQKMMTATQLMSDRERSETDFRRDMFKPMIDQILNDSVHDTRHLKTRIEIFKVFQNNFHDLFNSRSLYDELDDAVRKMKDNSLKKEFLKDLVDLARQTNQDEELLIMGNTIILDSLKTGSLVNSAIGETKKDSGHKFHMKVNLIDNLNGFVRITLTLYMHDKDSIVLNNGEPFSVGYYDSPLTDNILLPDKDRIAVVLQDIYNHGNSNDTVKMAKLKIIHFPGNFITTGYRPSIPAIQNLLQEEPKQNNQ